MNDSGTLPRWGALWMLIQSSGVLAAARPAVVELFTSQGCNSCPPADALLGELAERSDVLALSFHVDYWDKFGWRDRFALPAAKERQFAYVRHFGQDWVYTPEMVIDGHVDVLGANRIALQQQLASARSGVPVHITVQGRQLDVSIEAAPGSPESDVLLIGYQASAVTAIAVGENAGRDLHEFNIVRSIATLGRWTGAAAQWHVDLKTLPADAAKVAVLLQPPAPGPIIGAASAAVPR